MKVRRKLASKNDLVHFRQETIKYFNVIMDMRPKYLFYLIFSFGVFFSVQSALNLSLSSAQMLVKERCQEINKCPLRGSLYVLNVFEESLYGLIFDDVAAKRFGDQR